MMFSISVLGCVLALCAVALAVTPYTVYTGGFFSSPGARVAGWNGTSWDALAGGVTVGESVLAIGEYRGLIYIGGTFTQVGGSVAVTNIATWDPAQRQWATLNGGGAPGSYVLSFLDSGGLLYVGGVFSSLGGTAANNVATWDGATATPLGAGVNGNVNALCVYKGYLYAAGAFTQAGGSVAASKIAAWDGAAWSALTSGTNGDIFALAAYGEVLYVGGGYGSAGGVARAGISTWNGAAWASGPALGGSPVYVFALTVKDRSLYVGGQFSSVPGSISANNIAVLNGSTWSAIGTGLSDLVTAIDTLGAGHGVVAGGYFGDLSRVAGWTTDGGPAFAALGSTGVNDIVRAVHTACRAGYYGSTCTPCTACSAGSACRDGIAGDGVCGCAAGRCGPACTPCPFATVAASRTVASWTGSGLAQLGDTLSTNAAHSVVSLVSFQGSLYAFGSFDGSGSATALSNAARWDRGQSKWLPLDAVHGDLNGAVTTAVHVGGPWPPEDSIVVAGSFTSAGGASNSASLAYWGGTSQQWHAFDTAVLTGAIYALAVTDSGLFVGGSFTYVNPNTGPTANLVQFYTNGPNKGFFTLGAGPDGPVAAMVYYAHNKLLVGGSFTKFNAIPVGNVFVYNVGLSTVTSLGTGLDGSVLAAAALRLGDDVVSDGIVVFGGQFTHGGGQAAATRVATWNSVALSALGPGRGTSSSPAVTSLFGYNIHSTSARDNFVLANGGRMLTIGSQGAIVTLPGAAAMTVAAPFCQTGSGYYGAACTPCADFCNVTTCSDGPTGTGHCTCQQGFQDRFYRPAGEPSECDACDGIHYGPTCQRCPTCDIGNCNAGYDGDGSCICLFYATGPTCASCLPGTYGPYCQGVCTCAHNGTCVDGRGGNGACECTGHYGWGHCENCQSGYAGADCGIACPATCAAHGHCDDGIGGTGTCTCNTGWIGAGCDVCAPGYYGPACDQFCQCAYGAPCDEGLTGTGGCTCTPPMTGPTCLDCLPNYFGAECAQACPHACVHGHCNDGPYGDGTCMCIGNAFGDACDSCLENTFGVNCTLCPVCANNGTCSSGTLGNGTCVCPPSFAGPTCGDCEPGYAGPACEVACPTNCGHGTCDTGPAGSGVCLCEDQWTGPTCHSCVAGAYGPTCASCPVCANGGTCNEGVLGDGQCVCVSIFVGPTCEECPAGMAGPACDLACPADCGHGHCDAGIGGSGQCVCDAKWAAPGCTTCTLDTFGPQCTPCAVCSHGACRSGLDGDGICACVGTTDVYDRRCGCNAGFCGPHCRPCPFLAGGPSTSSPSTWNGVAWTPVGTTYAGSVLALVRTSNLTYYAVGDFSLSTNRSGIASISAIGNLNPAGNEWHQVARVLGPVRAAAEYNGDLFFGGLFTSVNGDTRFNVARATSDGTVTALGAGLSGSPGVYAIVVFNGTLVFGGRFSSTCTAAFEGNSWTGFGTNRGPCNNPDVGDTVFALLVTEDHSHVLAGGSFDGGVKQWDGQVWSILPGGGANDAVTALGLHEGHAIAGGYFTGIGGVSAHRIASWDGTVWSALGGGVVTQALVILSYDGQLFVGLDAYSGFYPAIMRWNGVLWKEVPTPSGPIRNGVGALALLCPPGSGFYGPTCLSCSPYCNLDAGTCTDGMQQAGPPTCQCSVGATGVACNACNPGFYGRACLPCNCSTQGVCNDGIDGDGACACSPLFTGTHCDECVPDRYGPQCLPCASSCPAHGSCDDGIAGSGTCMCDPAWAGSDMCDECAPGYYGPSCDSCQACGSHGACSAGTNGTGMCICSDGWTGDTCAACAPARWGAACTLCAVCNAHSACDNGTSGTGACLCQTGWTGETCAVCAPGYFGLNCTACPVCNSHSTCRDGLTGAGTCACATGWVGADCTDCAPDRYGPTCASCPVCSAGGAHKVCDAGVAGTGLCVCAAGWSGVQCTSCAPGYFGAACTACPDCGVSGSCRDGTSGNGSCACVLNWAGATCETCTADRYGADCTGMCPTTCVDELGPHGVCDSGVAGNGSCVCASGWTGAAGCDACASGFFGDVCAPCPDCGAHGVCWDGPAGNGTCACDSDWTGPVCAACAAGQYGPDCSGTCPVSCTAIHGLHSACDAGVAGTGSCVCTVGWTGTQCDACAAGYFGVACTACPQTTCSGNGVCVDGLAGNGTCACVPGWSGAECSVPHTPTPSPSTADLGATQSQGASSGAVAAAVIVPLVVLGAIAGFAGAYYYYLQHGKLAKATAAYSESLGQVGTELAGMPASPANAAVSGPPAAAAGPPV